MNATTTSAPAGRARPVARLVGSLEVLALSPTEWRVRTTGLPDGDGTSVLGVVQLLGDTYEVTQIGAPLFRYYFASLDEAVEYLGNGR